MRDAIVIGSGIMGATIAGRFRAQGRDTLVLDSHDPLAGTGPCGGSVKPSPLTGLSKDQEGPILKTLESLFGLTKEVFHIHPSGGFLKADVWKIDMERVFATEHVHVVESRIVERKDKPLVEYVKRGGEVRQEQCKVLVVAAGLGSTKLLPEALKWYTLSAKQGVSFRFKGQTENPFVQAWAPYKQITVHNFNDEEIWASDGSALKPENWTELRTKECLSRIQGAMDRTDDPLKILTGLRSFHEDKPKPCFLEKVHPRVWLAVGAGKFGCLAAGWAANQIAEDATDDRL